MIRVEKFKTGSTFYSLMFKGRYLAVDTSSFVRVKLDSDNLNKGIAPKDFVGRGIRDRASEFDHKNILTHDSLPKKRDPNYLLQLYVPWEASHLQLTISKISKGMAVLASPGINSNAVIINCKPNLLETKEDDSFWEGYSKENNLLDKLRKQIDYSADPLNGIYMNPSGGLTIEYMGGGLNKSRILSGTIVAAIVYSVPSLYISFGGYYRFLLSNMFSRDK